MESKSSNSNESKDNIVLKPNPQLPLIIIILGIILEPLSSSLWPTVIVGSFGLFLLIQSFTLRLVFTPKDLIVNQLGKELRRFPFENWISWRIFLPKLPGLLYFREKASPHLLPIIFDRINLEKQLKEKVGNLEISPDNSQN
tara:strand:- start:68 stop:493 length:426 start_codon:yes stop_codon:yes gene_type:complete